MRRLVFYILIPLFILIINKQAFSQLIDTVFTKGVKEDTVIVVDKSKKQLFVIKINNDVPEIDTIYENILLGEVEGDKQVEGDKKTPEGIYKIVSFIPKEKLSAIYGDGAYPLNYPNPVDKILGKTGYGIWIHGLDESSDKQFTQGCVALHNGDINNLRKFEPIGKNVIIAKETKLLGSTDYIFLKSKLINILNDYISSWEKNDFEKFASFYHTKFKNNKGKSFKSYILMKKRLMELYPFRRIYYDNLKILKGDDRYLYYGFRQLYCASNLISEGYKELYFMKQIDDYKLIYENFYEYSDLSILKKYISEFVQSWLDYWKSKNIEEYIKFYGENFYSKGMDKSAWKAYKEKIFNNTQDIDIKIKDMKIVPLNSNNITVSFIQSYSADNYSDVGYKVLKIKGCPGNFRIFSESWSKIE
ncbi:L,D-transpeptidase family protein [Deferribacter thermophilus]|uniref:L,D-transpeptidase family protein n=1 Tax=Deferribacter thermophilus TaxID=53573 RepID=UPI003C214B71